MPQSTSHFLFYTKVNFGHTVVQRPNTNNQLAPAAFGPTETSSFLFVAAYVWFACNFDFSSFCGWTSETGTGAEWLIQTNGAPAVHRGPTLDHTGRRCVFTFVFKGFFLVFFPTSTTRQMLWESTPWLFTLLCSCWKPVWTSFARRWTIFNYCTL